MDFDTEYIMGHSSGNHIAMNYLIEGCGKFMGAILMSPVDGTDPWGINPEYCIHPGYYLNFELPTLILAAGLDPVSGIKDEN